MPCSKEVNWGRGGGEGSGGEGAFAGEVGSEGGRRGSAGAGLFSSWSDPCGVYVGARVLEVSTGAGMGREDIGGCFPCSIPARAAAGPWSPEDGELGVGAPSDSGSVGISGGRGGAAGFACECTDSPIISM